MSYPFVAETTVLFRPVGPKELALIERSGFAGFAPRHEGQPYFYPVQNEEYATETARDRNAKALEIGAGFMMRFRVQTEYLVRFELRTVASQFTKNTGFRPRSFRSSTDTSPEG
jgi:hypothetical protein